MYFSMLYVGEQSEMYKLEEKFLQDLMSEEGEPEPVLKQSVACDIGMQGKTGRGIMKGMQGVIRSTSLFSVMPPVKKVAEMSLPKVPVQKGKEKARDGAKRKGKKGKSDKAMSAVGSKQISGKKVYTSVNLCIKISAHPYLMYTLL